jgi:anti-sigma B factor antagonist
MLRSAYPRSLSRRTTVTFAVSESKLDDHTTVLAFEGELDLANAPRLKAALIDALSDGDREVVLDLSGVSFIDSTSLRVLIEAQHRWHESAAFAIACRDKNVLRIFKIAGFDLGFEIYPTLEEALSRSREQGSSRS